MVCEWLPSFNKPISSQCITDQVLSFTVFPIVYSVSPKSTSTYRHKMACECCKIVYTLNLGWRCQLMDQKKAVCSTPSGKLHSSSQKKGLSPSIPQVNVQSKIMTRKNEQKGERVRNLTTALISMFEKAALISQLINLSNVSWMSLTSNSITHRIANVFQTGQKVRRGDEREKERDKETRNSEYPGKVVGRREAGS